MTSFGKVQKNDWVLVTGVTGLLGASIAHDLASRGFRVKGVTREIGDKTRQLQEKLEKLHGKGVIQFVEVKNQSEPIAYKYLLQGVAGVIHSSYDLTSLEPAKAIGTASGVMIAILEAAQKTPSVKSVVVTSSNAAAYWPSFGDDVKVSLDQYNELAVKLAYELPNDSPMKFGAVYSALKVVSEQKLWEWIGANGPSFSVNTVLPHMILGKPFNPAPGVYSTSTWLQWVFQGKLEGNPGVAFWSPAAWHIHVDDAATIHVGALIDQETDKQRIWAAAVPARSLNDALALWRSKYAGRELVKDFDAPGPPNQILDNRVGERLMAKYGQGEFKGFDEMVLDTVEDVA